MFVCQVDSPDLLLLHIVSNISPPRYLNSYGVVGFFSSFRNTIEKKLPYIEVDFTMAAFRVSDLFHHQVFAKIL